MCTLFCSFNTCVSCITFFLGLAASHSSKDPPSLAYWLFASPQLNSVRWCCRGRAKRENYYYLKSQHLHMCTAKSLRLSPAQPNISSVTRGTSWLMFCRHVHQPIAHDNLKASAWYGNTCGWMHVCAAVIFEPLCHFDFAPKSLSAWCVFCVKSFSSVDFHGNLEVFGVCAENCFHWQDYCFLDKSAKQQWQLNDFLQSWRTLRSFHANQMLWILASSLINTRISKW